MYICMYICIHIYIHIYRYVCIYIYIHQYIGCGVTCVCWANEALLSKPPYIHRARFMKRALYA